MCLALGSNYFNLLTHFIFFYSLGAPHDPTSGQCGGGKKFIMAPYVAYAAPGSTNTDFWLFSSCSVEDMKDYVQGMG